MKIALACQSILLEKSLEMFLKSYIVPYRKCDFVISDRQIEIDKPLFYIATEDSELALPFSKSALMLKIDKFYASLDSKDSTKKIKKSNKTKKRVKKVQMKELEVKITKLTDNFRDDLVNVIKEYYDN